MANHRPEPPSLAGDLGRLPGHEIVTAGLADLAAGRQTEASLVVCLAAERLRDAGVDVPAVPAGRPSHHLYQRLAEQHGDAAHSRYNALLGRVVSFARAAEHATAR